VAAVAAVHPQQLILADEIAERDWAGGIGHRFFISLRAGEARGSGVQAGDVKGAPAVHGHRVPQAAPILADWNRPAYHNATFFEGAQLVLRGGRVSSVAARPAVLDKAIVPRDRWAAPYCDATWS
jgi:hypothetical protein